MNRSWVDDMVPVLQCGYHYLRPVDTVVGSRWTSLAEISHRAAAKGNHLSIHGPRKPGAVAMDMTRALAYFREIPYFVYKTACSRTLPVIGGPATW
jgi:hypothetical protein